MRTAVLSREQMTSSTMYVRLADAQQEPTGVRMKIEHDSPEIVFEVSLFEWERKIGLLIERRKGY